MVLLLLPSLNSLIINKRVFDARVASDHRPAAEEYLLVYFMATTFLQAPIENNYYWCVIRTTQPCSLHSMAVIYFTSPEQVKFLAGAPVALK
jgi:hypothetical protein